MAEVDPAVIREQAFKAADEICEAGKLTSGQLNDVAEGGNVAHYEPSNVLIITGRANVVNRLVEIVRRVDTAGDQDVESVSLKYASATEVARIINSLMKESSNSKSVSVLLVPTVAADERTNSVIISGDPKARARVRKIIEKLDRDQAYTGNTRVIYLKYAKAKNVLEVLSGVGKEVAAEKSGESSSSSSSSSNSKFSIYADEDTNAVIISAQPDVMKEMEDIIAKLDIRRAQVYVEAIIAEISTGNTAQLGIQWGILGQNSGHARLIGVKMVIHKIHGIFSFLSFTSRWGKAACFLLSGGIIP